MERPNNVDRVPENAMNMPTDCPVCLEPLFNEMGIAEKEVAKIMCPHLVHSDCLKQASRALNSDGNRYGVGGFGIRAGCPICGQAVSFWESFSEAAAFSVFWMHRIQACLEEIGPGGGPIAVSRVQDMLKNDSQLTEKQKGYLNNAEDKRYGFAQALKDGDSVWVNNEVRDGGPENGGSLVSYWKDGMWELNQETKTLWMRKWGPSTSRDVSSRGDLTMPETSF
jgi:hypothetical protein